MRKKPSRFSKARRTTQKSKLKKLQQDVSKLKGQIERKSIDHAVSWTNVTTIEAVQDINGGINQGSGDTERIGNKITAKSMQVKYQCKIGDGVANDSYNQMRAIVLRYVVKDPTVSINLKDILANYSGTAPEQTMVSPYKRDSEYTFTIMYDKVHNLYWGNNSGVSSGGAPRIKSANLKFNLKDHPIRYDDQNLLKTKYALIFVSDSGAITHPQVCFHTRFYYTDK